jgi:hypothetical protein
MQQIYTGNLISGHHDPKPLHLSGFWRREFLLLHRHSGAEEPVTRLTSASNPIRCPDEAITKHKAKSPAQHVLGSLDRSKLPESKESKRLGSGRWDSEVVSALFPAPCALCLAGYVDACC